MARAIQSPKKQLARLSVSEMKSALPKLQRRINEINAIDPAQAVNTYTPEFSAISQNANATLTEIFGSDSVEYERFKILSIYAGRNSYTQGIPRHEVIAGYIEGKKRALIKIDSAIKFINEKLVDSQSVSEITSKEEEWISAARALAMLAMREYEGTRTICKRAHAGLIKARAIRFINNGRSTDNVDIPIEFWWAEGEAALNQNWTTGDFDTWIGRGIDESHLQAFGVTFRRSDIEQSRPTPERRIIGSNEVFLDEEKILELKSIKGRFDFAKLIRFCEELNDSYHRRNYLACMLLIRAVLNHVPPIFGAQTFGQVVANSGKSVKTVLSRLEDEARPIADLHTHILIRARESLPTKNQVEPYKASFEILIQEILANATAT